MKINQENKSNFWLFPERVKTINLFFIVFLAIIITFFCGVLLSKHKVKPYLPEYKEQLYAEELNTSLLVFSSYTVSDKKLVKTNRITVQSSQTKADFDYSIAGVKATLFGLYEDDFEYISNIAFSDVLDTYYSGKVPTARLHTNQIQSLPTASKKDYLAVQGRVVFNVVRNNEGTEKEYSFREDFLTLTKQEIEKIETNEIFASNLFDSYSTTVSEGVTSKNIYLNLALKSAQLEKQYHMDYQLFGVDEAGEIYTLLGMYNMSRAVNASVYQRSTTFPKDYPLKYLVGKLVFTDSEGKTTTLYSKVNY